MLQKNKDRIRSPLVFVATAAHEHEAKAAGAKFVRRIEPAAGPAQIMDGDTIKPELAVFESYILALPPGMEMIRDDIAIRVGDQACEWVTWHDGADATDVLAATRKMWNDEIATIDDIPDGGDQKVYTTGFDRLDEHGLRITLPAFMPLIGPYGSGKSIFLRQLLVNLYRLHGWKFLITSFEEKVKPRYIRDLRIHLIDKPRAEWTARDVIKADGEIRVGARFLVRKRNTILDADRLLDLITFAVKAHGVRVVAIDPVNEIDHQVGKGESKTDYMGRFIMRLKALADDYGLLVICCAHPPKDGVEKRSAAGRLLTLNDGADTAHWGNKADIGFVMWRPMTGFGPSLLNIDKLKDHETMGKPTLAELHLNPMTGRLDVGRIGYDIIGGGP
jgi:archaellum biogenesis ATPase FlaH